MSVKFSQLDTVSKFYHNSLPLKGKHSYQSVMFVRAVTPDTEWRMAHCIQSESINLRGYPRTALSFGGYSRLQWPVGLGGLGRGALMPSERTFMGQASFYEMSN